MYLLLTFQFSNVILCSEKTDRERPSSKNVINTLLSLIFNQDACLGPLKWETLIIFQESLSCRYLKKCFPFIISVWRIHRVNLSKPLQAVVLCSICSSFLLMSGDSYRDRQVGSFKCFLKSRRTLMRCQTHADLLLLPLQVFVLPPSCLQTPVRYNKHRWHLR